MTSRERLDLVDMFFNKKRHVTNRFKILSDDYKSFSADNLYKLAENRIVEAIKGMKVTSDGQFKNEYESLYSETGWDLRTTRVIKSVVIVSDLAYELFLQDKTVPFTENNIVEWMRTPNSVLFGNSPFEACLIGNSDELIRFLCGKLEIKIGDRGF